VTETASSPFLVGMRGYDRVQVDDYVRATEEQLTAERTRSAGLSARLDEADSRVSELQAALDEREPSGDQAMNHERLGRRVAGILRLADEEAAEVRATADAYEVATREAAEELARTLIDAAETRADELSVESRARVEASDAQARIRLAQAEDEGRRIVDAASEQARVVEEQWRVRHEAAAHELTAVLARRDAVLGEIERLREALGGVRSAAGVTAERSVPAPPENHSEDLQVSTAPAATPAGASAIGYAEGV